MTRDEARALWASSGLTYADLTPAALQSLRRCVDDAMRASGLIRGTYRCHQRFKVRHGKDGTVVSADLRCRSYYFNDRQAVTFEAGGFIGFAGWADDSNIEPVLRGFTDWVHSIATAAPQDAAIRPVSALRAFGSAEPETMTTDQTAAA